MANPYNGSANGKPGGRNRPSRKDPKPHTTATAEVAKLGPFWDCAENDETIATHLIPRRSLTVKTHIGVFPQQIETEDRIGFQIDPITGERTPVTRKRVTWKSDRSLLLPGKPDAFGEGKGTTFKRLTSQSKRIVRERPEVKPVDHTPHDGTLGPDASHSEIKFTRPDAKPQI
jgi:hypothetical protein